MVNIVVFGKAQSGKSTLLGYLYSKSNKKFNINEFERKTKAQLENSYRPSYLFAYIMDESKDERIIKPGTRKLHIRKIALNEFTRITVIDTPGAEHHIHPKQRGVFYGDIGIFCLKLNDVISDKFMSASKETISIMSMLLLWSRLGHKKIIIALTQCDESNFSQSAFLSAKKFVYSLCGSSNIEDIKVIPIAINVADKIGFNIVDRSSQLDWYDGTTLIQTLTDEIKSVTNSLNDNLLFCIHDQINKPASKAGKVWMIKIIQGKLSVGDRIRISPVLLTKNHNFADISCVVKTLRYDLHKEEGSEVIETAASGDIVGLDIKDIYNNNEKIDKKSFDTIYSTCGFSRDVKYITSDLFSFAMKPQYNDIVVLKRQFSLMLFGRAVSFSVEKVSHDDTSGDLIIVARIYRRKITLPVYDSGKYYFTRLIIKDGNERLSNPYYEGRLLDILKE